MASPLRGTNFFSSTLVGIFLLTHCAFAQPVPPSNSNIPFLVTFGKNASKKYGDDDFSQVFFLSVPANESDPFYIRVFDPDVGGEHDEIYGSRDTKTKFQCLTCYRSVFF